MGGKSFFCDYCGCFIFNDIRVRKTHNSGLMHKIAKANYMRCYEDPRTILKEEKSKTPCTRFPKGHCKFGLYCQYTHYSPTQLKELEEIVEKLERNEKLDSETNSKLKKRKRRILKKKNKLPPSLRGTVKCDYHNVQSEFIAYN